jgi:hypothetical protein
VRLSARSLAAAIAAAVVLSPLLREPQNDTYPLSTFPMFASDRGEEHHLDTAVMIADDGSVQRLSPELIAGTDEPVLAAVTLTRGIRRGDASIMCEEIAARIGGLAVVEVRTEHHNVINFIADDAPPLGITTHASCGGDD